MRLSFRLSSLFLVLFLTSSLLGSQDSPFKGFPRPYKGNAGCAARLARAAMFVGLGLGFSYVGYTAKPDPDLMESRVIVLEKLPLATQLAEIKAETAKRAVEPGYTVMGEPRVLMEGWMQVVSPQTMQDVPRKYWERLFLVAPMQTPLVSHGQNDYTFVSLRTLKHEETGALSSEWLLVAPEMEGGYRISDVWIDEGRMDNVDRAGLEPTEANAASLAVRADGVVTQRAEWESKGVGIVDTEVVPLEVPSGEKTFAVFIYGRQAQGDDPVRLMKMIVKFDADGKSFTVQYFTLRRPGNYS